MGERGWTGPTTGAENIRGVAEILGCGAWIKVLCKIHLDHVHGQAVLRLPQYYISTVSFFGANVTFLQSISSSHRCPGRRSSQHSSHIPSHTSTMLLISVLRSLPDDKTKKL